MRMTSIIYQFIIRVLIIQHLLKTFFTTVEIAKPTIISILSAIGFIANVADPRAPHCVD
jgi:hypothetical protein